MQEPGSREDEEAPPPDGNPQRREPTDPVPVEEPEQDNPA